jgi:hypothetical protein
VAEFRKAALAVGNDDLFDLILALPHRGAKRSRCPPEKGPLSFLISNRPSRSEITPIFFLSLHRFSVRCVKAE